MVDGLDDLCWEISDDWLPDCEDNAFLQVLQNLINKMKKCQRIYFHQFLHYYLCVKDFKAKGVSPPVSSLLSVCEGL